jgi:small subunit ribosomal protein S1
MTEERHPTDSFAAMFEQSATPSRRSFKVGERVEGRVVQVGASSVFVELDGGVQGYFDSVELRLPDGTLPVTVGETLAARVTEVDAGRGHVRLSRQASIARALKPSGDKKGGKGRDREAAGDGGAAFQQALESQVPVDGKVTGVNKGGLEVDVAGARAFCPMSQAADRFLEDPKVLVGETFKFLVTEVRDGGKSVVLSRKAFLKREAAEGRLGDGGDGEGKGDAGAAKGGKPAAPKGPEVAIVLGSVVKGTVDRIESYGVFLQVEGTRGREGRGLVPAAELGVPRGTDLRKKFPQGTVLTAKVLDVGEGKLRLSVRGAQAAEEQADLDSARAALAKSGAAGGNSFGTFADLLTRKK